MFFFLICFRKQFFLNVKYEIMNGKYDSIENKLPRLYALIAQVESGQFKENHISYNPSRTSNWDSNFRTRVIFEHSKLYDMSPEVAKFFCLKEVAEIDEYGMEYYAIRSEDNSHDVQFGIGIDSIRIDHGDEEIQRYLFCFKTHKNIQKSVAKNESTTKKCLL